jgi:hypothetical protein
MLSGRPLAPLEGEVAQVQSMPKAYQYVLLSIVCLGVLLALQSEAAGAVFEVPLARVTSRQTADVPGAGMTGKARRLVVRSTFFREMAPGAQSHTCQATAMPEPLATPNPILDLTEHLRLTVSFVVGMDGHVYGPLVLEGMSRGVKAAQIRPVVDAVRTWRFRPAVCNGAPTESEAKVEFYSSSNRF